MLSHASSNDESRTSSVGARRPARSRKRGRRHPQELRKESELVGPDSSSILPIQTSMPSNSTSTDRTAMTDSNQLSNMIQGLGNNRLASGFVRRPASTTDQIEDTSNSGPSPGVSADSPIEISSDEDMEDVGGMVINLQGQDNISIEETSEEGSSDAESGEYISSSASRNDLENQDADTESGNNRSSHKLRKLADLTQDQLEEQLRYGFYYLERDQIDLTRPVICLQCSMEGHLGSDCPEKFTARNPFPVVQINPGAYVKLWISCCVCASKSHLVGDCPRADKAGTTRWSLASLDPNQITNLSLGGNVSRLETEAENRGMRPPGLQIRGHANRHTAGYSHTQGQGRGHGHQSQESSEEEFLPSHRRQPPNLSANTDRNTRYDRFAGPQLDQSANRARSGGPWYNTDSFGQRRRSRSPMTTTDQQQPQRNRQAAAAPRPPPPPPAPASRRKNKRNSSPPPRRQNISIQLPARPNFNTR